MKPTYLCWGAVLTALPVTISAQVAERTEADSLVVPFFGAFVPIVVILCVAVLIYVYLIRPNTREDIKRWTRQEQHLKHVERTLDRIATALEKRDGGS